MTGVCGGSPTQAWNCRGRLSPNMLPWELMMKIALVRSMSPVMPPPEPTGAPGAGTALFQPDRAASTPPLTRHSPSGPMSYLRGVGRSNAKLGVPRPNRPTTLKQRTVSACTSFLIISLSPEDTERYDERRSLAWASLVQLTPPGPIRPEPRGQGLRSAARATA